MDPAQAPESPFLWWGPSDRFRPRRSLCWLVEQGMLSAPVAALLATAVSRRLSLAVVAEPSGAGKTTLLTAAAAHLPPDARRIYPRGQWESFAFLDNPDVRPGRDVLLVNEISPHVPGYLWGAGVGRTVDAARRGFTVMATAHARDAAGLSGVLTEADPSQPATAVAAFHLVAAIEIVYQRRRVDRVWALAPPGPGALRIVPVCAGDATLAGVADGLHRATNAGWPTDRLPPDVAGIVEAMQRLDAVDDDVGDSRPGRMLARSRSTRPNGRAVLP